jgi:hypothetical protein
MGYVRWRIWGADPMCACSGMEARYLRCLALGHHSEYVKV